MTQPALERNVGELLTDIEGCFQSKFITPGLVLLYASIDIMASLHRPESHPDVTRSDFIEWVNDYLLPNQNLACTAMDLYAARCSLIHSYSSESRLSREGNAKPIFYAWGTGPTEYLENLIDTVGNSPRVALHVEQLLDAFRTGVERFQQRLHGDPNMSALVKDRTEKFFINMPYLGEH